MKTLFYGRMRVQDLVNVIGKHPDLFPNGMNTFISCGDYEGNYNHRLLSVEDNGYGPKGAVKLYFELHD